MKRKNNNNNNNNVDVCRVTEGLKEKKKKQGCVWRDRHILITQMNRSRKNK